MTSPLRLDENQIHLVGNRKRDVVAARYKSAGKRQLGRTKRSSNCCVVSTLSRTLYTDALLSLGDPRSSRFISRN
jgi:hypothetical protein